MKKKNFYLLFLLLCCFFIVCGGCSIHRPSMTTDSAQVPATIICIMSACDVVIADRTVKSKEGNIKEDEEQKVKQEAKAKSDLSLPLTIP